MRKTPYTAAAVAALLALAGCTAADSPGADIESPAAAASSGPTAPSVTATAEPSPSTRPGESGEDDAVEGAVVRFSAGDTAVDVTIGPDNPTVRDFLSLLPTTVTMEEFNGREKIGYMSRELETEGSPGSDPEDGDLIYFVPWGNLGFYYNTAGIDYSDETIHIGRYDATAEELESLENTEVTIERLG